MEAYDYIIVGAGSAGCALAYRLTDSGRHRVLLLEAGGRDRSVWVHMPIGYGKTYYDERINWKYMTEPEPGLGGNRSYWPRGKVLGGSSSINAMVYVRGHPRDYDDWAEVAPGWGWDDVAPVFKRMEDWSGEASDWRGKGGPVSVYDVASDIHPLTRTYLKAAEQNAIAVNPDYNGAEMEGATCYQITTKGGLRASAARGYLWPARQRHNLRVETRAHATQILFEGKRAVGVEYQQNGHLRQARAGEVILSGGAINSPQILQLSGIGPGDLLQQHGIPLVCASPQVGENLRDHLGLDHLFRANVPTLNQELGPWLGKLRAGMRYLLTRRGPLSLSLNQGGGFVRVMPDATRPDAQLYFSPVSYTRAPPGTRPLMNPDPFPGFLLGFNPCKPTSKGHVHIRAPDPDVAPELRANYLNTEHDRRMMVAGVRFLRKISEAPALSAVIDHEIEPGPDVQSDDEIADFARAKSWTVFHQCGTCQMGRDVATSVVDARLRVHGTERLRVVDASVFPGIPTGNTNAPAMMVGERASDLILEDAKR